MTNLERLQSMTAEELAKLLSSDLWKTRWCKEEAFCILMDNAWVGSKKWNCPYGMGVMECYTCLLNWLKSEETQKQIMP